MIHNPKMISKAIVTTYVLDKNQSINPYANLQKIDIIHIRFRWILIYFDDLFDNLVCWDVNIIFCETF